METLGQCKSVLRWGLYGTAQLVWGLPQTLAGFGVFLAHANHPRYWFHGAVVTMWNSNRALSLGPFIFLRGVVEKGGGRQPSSLDEGLLVHEYGHTVQSLIVGPLYLLAVGLPSVLWLNIPAFARMRREKHISYYSFFTERSANWLGERVLKLPSVGLAHID